MNFLEKRSEKTRELLEGRFIRKVLQEEGSEIDSAQEELMNSRGFESRDFFSDRKFNTDTNKLVYTHLPKHRFVDMSYLTGKNIGRFKKKNHPVHNRVLYGHANNIVRQLKFGFTDAVKDEMMKDLPDI